MSYIEKTERKYAEKVEKESKVLLVCVYDTVVLNITYDMLRPKFQQFGKIINMLIFQKGEVTKLFIQYAQIAHAVKAKNKLDGTKLCDSICKMTIYFSNFANVEVMNDPEESGFNEKYYENESGIEMAVRQNYSSFSNKSNQSNFYNIDDEQIMESFSAFNMKRSKTEDPHLLKIQIENAMSVNISQHQATQNEYKYLPQPINYMNSWYSQKQDESYSKMKEQNLVRSPILWFGYKYPLKTKFIYNLFSNFGNISCVILKKQKVYIKFRTKQFAAMANTYLNGTILAGNVLDLRECPEQSTVWKINEGEYCQCAYYDSNFDRFTAQRSITINPPANTIHVSSIKRDACKEKNLRQIFSKYGDIERIQILQNSNDKNMALIRFQSLEDSFNAICNMHNQMISGRKMQISFTKSKV